MPRVSKPLQVSPEELETLKSNLAHADEGLAERIRIVMGVPKKTATRPWLPGFIWMSIPLPNGKRHIRRKG